MEIVARCPLEARGKFPLCSIGVEFEIKEQKRLGIYEIGQVMDKFLNLHSVLKRDHPMNEEEKDERRQNNLN